MVPETLTSWLREKRKEVTGVGVKMRGREGERDDEASNIEKDERSVTIL